MCAEDTQRGWGMHRARPPTWPRPVPSLEFPETGEVWLFGTVISSRLQLLWECMERERERLLKKKSVTQIMSPFTILILCSS